MYHWNPHQTQRCTQGTHLFCCLATASHPLWFWETGVCASPPFALALHTAEGSLMSQVHNMQPPPAPPHSAHIPSTYTLLPIPHHMHTTSILPCSVSTQTSYSVVHVTSQAYNRQPPTLCSAHKPVILLSTSHHRHTTGSLPLSAHHTNQLFCCPRHITGIQQAASHSLLSTQTSYSVVHVTSQAYSRQPPTLCSAHKLSVHTLLSISHHKPAQFII